jgi:hypothetical protein
LNDQTSNLDSIADMLALEIGDEAVVLDARKLEVVANKVTATKEWWSGGKKFYVVKKTEFEVILT